MQENPIMPHIPEIKLKPVNLPSKGKSYPENVEISYRGYLFGELQFLNASKGLSIKDLLENIAKGIKVQGISLLDLTLPDLTYIGIARRMSTFGATEFEIKHSCRACNAPIKKVFTQMDITFNDLSLDGYGVEMELTTGKTYLFSPLTYGDFLKLFNGTISATKRENLVKDKLAVLAAMCRNHNFDTVYTDLYNITNQDDIDAIDEVNKQLHHDVKPLKHICENPKCGAENAISLEGRDFLINPFRGGREASKPRVRSVQRVKPQPLSHKDDGV